MKKTSILILFTVFCSILNLKTYAEMNPFFNEFRTPYNIPPFELIKDEHYRPAFYKGMESHLEEINAIVDSIDPPSFENTIIAFERAGKDLDIVSSTFFNLLSSNTNDEMDQIASEIGPILSGHYDSIYLNKALFNRVKSIFDARSKLDLSTEQFRLIAEMHKDFVRSGAQLDDASMDTLTEINQELSSLTIEFDQNLLKETNEGYQLIIANTEQLDGLPKDVISQAAKLAQSEGHEGKWLFKPTRVSMYPFLTYSTQRNLREKLYNSYIKRGDNDNEYDNKANAIKIAKLRLKRANILGYDTHADFVLDNTMAQSTDRVKDLLDRVWEPGLATAKREVAEMQKMIESEGNTFDLAAWDWWYYSEKIRQLKYDFSEEEVKPYFSQSRVLQGAFDVATKLFDITFEERFDLPKYRENIRTFEVKDLNGSPIGVFYTDYTLRSNKGGGAWMNSFVDQSKFDGIILPVVMNTCNFPPPNEDGISLLSFEQVETLFHEFGHALHGLLSDVNYPSLSGTSVKRDYVEFPSQMMENWAIEPEVLATYARHYKTDEIIPQELINKITNASKFNQGFATTEYVAASYLDMAWHMEKQEIKDANLFEQKTLSALGLIDQITTRYRSTYFSHIFAGGYSMGYYSYLWTEVLEADAFVPFSEKGIFDKKTANKLKKYIYSAGNSDDLMTQYIRYRGSEPKIEALLKKRGFDE
ncbi:MAG: M3 family metallopeptidase [Gammaproteobacteria bacterium]|jgi:peptidyl-dipeptidase Dcp|nr:M3 family metallopeptidase [Gammaproteobacteria bacterium]MBT5217839.1 M3 family metallopeptidase [Gammaproteobacteria bacterium]MDG2434631.1 M3 family metallopeptidase [Gammaproteobacteria bacterium]